ncbi:Caskin-2, partial [Frankliniella fusca]
GQGCGQGPDTRAMSSKKPPGPPGGNGDDKKTNKAKPAADQDEDGGGGAPGGGADAGPGGAAGAPGPGPAGDKKPGSAGATSRDAALRLLSMCQKGEWPPVDQALKSLEKAVAAAKAEAKADPASAGEDVVTLPLAGVADPSTGMTPLMYAVKDNRTAFLDRMVDLGCDPTARNQDNYNALHVAAMYSREEVVKLLLPKKGVDVYAPGGPRSQTAVHLVASRQTGTATSILRVLLNAAGKDIRLRPDGVSHL